MAAPSQKLTIRDPGLGLVGSSPTRFVYFGTASKGTVNTIYPLNSPAAVEDAFGDGPLPEQLALSLQLSGGPVYGCRLTGTVAGAAGAVTPARIGTSTGTVTVAGAAYDRYEVVLEVTKTGALGAGEFRYSLDNKRNYSASTTIPTGGTFSIPRTNLTLTFVPGAGPVIFERGDLHSFATTAPHYSSTELALGCDAVSAYLSTSPGLEFDALIFTGRNATGAGAATLGGALATKMTGLENQFHYMRALIDGGSGDTTSLVKTALVAFGNTRVGYVYGDTVLNSSGKPFAGWGAPNTTLLTAAAALAQGQLPSTDAAAFVIGPLPVQSISYDEQVLAELDDAKISTARTWPGVGGFYLTNLRLKSPAGSDYEFWQEGRVMDIACRTIIKAQYPFMSSGFETNPDGTIEETEALMCEAGVKDALRAELMDPKRLNGKRGHISAFEYTIERTNNYALTRTLQSSTAIRGLQYAKRLEASIGYSLTAGA